jgi:hypothetical protein
MGMVITAMCNRAFALKKAGKEDEGKMVLREVIEMQLKLNEETKKKVEEEAAAAAGATSSESVATS